jgi:VanZ family protein
MRTDPAGRSRLISIIAAALLSISLFISAPSTGGMLVPPWDKLGHFVFYGTIAFLLAIGLGRSRLFLALLLTCSIGVADEAYQAILPGRQSDVMDLLTDVAAAVIVTLIVKFAAASSRPKAS